MFKEPFSFNGRIRRLEYGITYIITVSYAFLLDAIFETYGLSSDKVLLLFMLPAIWLFLAQGAKRCHDLGNDGLFQFIPFYIFWLIFAVGKNGRNKYGDDPKMGDKEEKEVEISDLIGNK